MKVVAMNYNRQTTNYEVAVWIYNEMKLCNNDVMISAQVAERISFQEARFTRRAIIVSYKGKAAEGLLVSMLLPMAWQLLRIIEDALAELTDHMRELLKPDRHYNIIRAGDFNVQMSAKAEEGWEKSMVERAQVRWERRMSATTGHTPTKMERITSSALWS